MNDASQARAEDGMVGDASRTVLQGRGRQGRGKARTHRRLHDEQRHRDGGQAGQEGRQEGGLLDPARTLQRHQHDGKRDADRVVRGPADGPFVAHRFGLRDGHVAEPAARHVGDPAAHGCEAPGGHAQALEHQQPQVQHGRGADTDEQDGGDVTGGEHGVSASMGGEVWHEL